MGALRYGLIRAGFEALWASQITHLVRSRSKARGIIFTLHRVLPQLPDDFSPNAILQVTPDFLDDVIVRVRELGFDIVSLDEGLRRLADPTTKRFVVLTFDDAYRDNLLYALPVLRRHEAPFTLYAPTALVDGIGEVWWQALEDIVARQDAIAVTEAGELGYLASETLAQKQRAYDALYWRMRRIPEPDRVRLIRELAAQYRYDLDAQCRELIMDWRELRRFANDPLCTLGAHTVHHYELAKLPAIDARNEIEQSARVIEAQFGTRPRHLSFPIGGTASAGPREYKLAEELGFASAVTTRPGALYARHAASPWSLPRISLNGLFQSRRYLDVFTAGALFSLRG